MGRRAYQNSLLLGRPFSRQNWIDILAVLEVSSCAPLLTDVWNRFSLENVSVAPVGVVVHATNRMNGSSLTSVEGEKGQRQVK